MSLLSSTQGTPERVWSLVSALAANEGRLQREEAHDLLNPGFTDDGSVVSENRTAFLQTLSAATSLGAVEVEQTTLSLSLDLNVVDFATFTDWVHDRLINLDSGEKDAVVLETYAWVAVQSGKEHSTGWINDWNNDKFADAADQSLPEGSDDDGDRRINTTKLPRWRHWLISLGLMVPIPAGDTILPLATARAARELARLDLPRNTALEAETFLTTLASRLPYLDGGRMFAGALRRQDYTKEVGQLSPILSACLRDLNDDGSIELSLFGDTGNAVTLWPDSTHPLQAFASVVVRKAS